MTKYITSNLREKISKILIKWGMPTRQVAINEIIELLEKQECSECRERWENDKK